MRDGNDIGDFLGQKVKKVTMYKLIIEHNTLHFYYAKDFAVSFFVFFAIFV